ncbi:MAG TPA: hypothetical protein VD811_10540 [Desulfuromonadales bacterium]|nr:hypothetical protein [Desulfuromonadales bacterium]
MAQENRRQSTARLSLTFADGMPEHLSCFFSLLQQGFCIRVQVGCGIRELLCSQFGIDPDYLKQRITTIFLNGKPVDDTEASRIAEGATLALSAAMPGLVGATMRRGGFYAAMRGAITHHESAEGAEEKYGTIRIKLFNLLMAELGPGFLRQGIVVPTPALANFLAAQAPDFWEGWSEIRLNGKPVAAGILQTGAWTAPSEELTELCVLFEE